MQVHTLYTFSISFNTAFTAFSLLVSAGRTLHQEPLHQTYISCRHAKTVRSCNVQS